MTVNLSGGCPLPRTHHDRVLLAHGGGGRLMQQLIEQVFLPAYGNPTLETRHDGAVLNPGRGRLAFTTDAYVVQPLFFPGGDIGELAVYGTVNDLAMCGARPLYLSASFILEEGLPLADLKRVAASMQAAASAAGVQIVTGDTKVVEHGKADGLYISTAGVGLIEHDLVVAPTSVRPGDAIIISGDIARHGMAIMSVREGLEFESAIESDCAPLNHIVQSLLDAHLDVHCLRDLTRGGLASGLIEIAQTARLAVQLDESAIPLREDVMGACEILGFDPLYVANEGKLVAFVPADQAEAAVAAMRAHPAGAEAAVIGTVCGEDATGLVTLRSLVGASRVLDLLSGEQLPRIC